MGEPAVWRGESREEYDDLLVAIANSVGAQDVIDWAWANDLAYHIWDGRRLQRLKADLMLAHQILVIEELLRSTYDPPNLRSEILYKVSDARNEARRWAQCPEFGRQIDDRLTERGHDRASVIAKAYVSCSSELQAIEAEIANRELRRMATLREITRHHLTKGKRYQKAASEILEGEFKQAA